MALPRILLLCTLVTLSSTVLVLLTDSDSEDFIVARLLAVSTAILFGTTLLVRYAARRTK